MASITQPTTSAIQAQPQTRAQTGTSNRRRFDGFRGFAYLLLTFMVIVYVLPLIWMLFKSVMSFGEANSPAFLPSEIHLENYAYVLTDPNVNFLRALGSTLILEILTVGGQTVFSLMAAYGFSRIRWTLREPLFYVCLSTIMLPFVAVMVPTYVLFKSLSWIGNLNILWGWAPLIVPAFGGNPLYIFLLRQFFLGIPIDLSEAAVIDGANEFQIFTRVILPLSRPALITVTLFTFVGSWTDFLAPRLFITQKQQYTLSLGLLDYFSLHQTEWTYLMAACVIFVLPVMVLFFFAQRLFVEGISLTGIKG